MIKTTGFWPIRFCCTLVLWFGCLDASLQAETNSFESAGDLSGYTLLATDATVTLTQKPALGAGNPASGDLDFLSTGSSDRSVVLHRVASSNLGAVT